MICNNYNKCEHINQRNVYYEWEEHGEFNYFKDNVVILVAFVTGGFEKPIILYSINTFIPFSISDLFPSPSIIVVYSSTPTRILLEVGFKILLLFSVRYTPSSILSNFFITTFSFFYISSTIHFSRKSKQ